MGIRVDSVFEFFVCLSIVCSLLACQQIFSFFPLSSFSFYTVKYRRAQYSTVIGQLPRVSAEDRVVSVFEPCVCLSVLCVSSNFLIFPSFILLFLYSTVQKSAVQYSYLLASSLEYPERIRVVSVFETLVCSLFACL